VDLPGYGFAKIGRERVDKLQDLIGWYLFDSKHDPKVVLIIDAEVGPTKDDLATLKSLEDSGKEIVVVANKIDKVKKSVYQKQMKKIADLIGPHKIIQYSSKDKKGMGELSDEVLGK
jgi:GTP-binding protein